MAKPPNSKQADLAPYSDDELLEEIVRRRQQPRGEQNGPWCEECAHFKTWPHASDPPPSYNPCSKRHTPAFWLPMPWEAPEHFGFYRTICADRKSMPEHRRETASRPRPVSPKRR